jgi:hypothetical protein
MCHKIRQYRLLLHARLWQRRIMANAPDRLMLAALVDRLIYDSETHFEPDDARQLLDLMPRVRSPWFELGVKGKLSGGSKRGFAAGVGDVKIEDKERQFDYSSANDAYTRAGQWKLLWLSKRRQQFVEIEQVMADATDDGKGARVNYTADGTPLSMDIRVNHSFRLFWSPVIVVFPGWADWKSPARSAISSTMPS